MHSRASIAVVLVCASVAPGACAGARGPAQSTARRFGVEVLKHGIDPLLISDRFSVDFDGDGKADPVTLTDSAVQVDLTGGGEFRRAETSGSRLPGH